MRRGPKPRPVAAPKLREAGLPRCPDHLDPAARKEWRRLARPLYEAGILTVADRAALAAYCQSWSLWAEAVRKLQQTPKLIKTQTGYIQQSPWIGIANKQLDLMGRYMSELGITPTSRSRLADVLAEPGGDALTVIRVIYQGADGVSRDREGHLIEGEAGDAIELEAEARKP